MTWASLWWRVSLLARSHSRRLRAGWLLWRRSRRTLRPATHQARFIRELLSAEPGAPIRIRSSPHLIPLLDGSFIVPE